MTRVVFLLAALGVAGAFAACDGGEGEGEGEALQPTLTDLHEKVFSVSCSASVCHGGPGPADGLDLVGDPFGTLVNVDSVDNPGMKRVVPGDPDSSVLFHVINGPFGNSQSMPQGGELLPQNVRDAIEQWIADGAQDN